MQQFPVAIHDDWTALLGIPLGTKDAIREGADMALSNLSTRRAHVEALGFAVEREYDSEDPPNLTSESLLIRARIKMADLPGVRVWEQTVNPSSLEAAGVDFSSPSAPHDVAAALHSLASDFVDAQRAASTKRHL